MSKEILRTINILSQQPEFEVRLEPAAFKIASRSANYTTVTLNV
jgi:hypothetical protein